MYDKKAFLKNFDKKKFFKLRNYYFTQYGITWHEILTVPAFNKSLVDVLKMIH